MSVTHEVFRLAYASRSLLPEATVAEEMVRLLEHARRNNAAAGITGALLFTEDAFVQVLEGTMEAVEVTFERIQCDPRHAEVVVLEAAVAPARDFAGWSMAYAGRQTGPHFDALAARTHAAPMDALVLLHGALGRLSGCRVPA
ncbi:BLUF domain-containing protein [Roseicella aquatilis]|uniref:BLUF domain-containing protein n=1 Tax=Roseicella aquatilis TaxID=2527868 RepID=A0A4R4DEI1_9PROT|nr:BLUF domain-containing protein [Roseicella aquatilis]TCZ57789.1 BLUF domain-containing protein [Roseicella aquatilis]